eukprot:GHVO01041222.1.p1 GENE.GHVO01041222.1~~GHVO01041222.1.p1  ORF type:complete len:149 (-),score=7.04 GHVO01041222.1:157-603(-)
MQFSKEFIQKQNMICKGYRITPPCALLTAAAVSKMTNRDVVAEYGNFEVVGVDPMDSCIHAECGTIPMKTNESNSTIRSRSASNSTIRSPSASLSGSEDMHTLTSSNTDTTTSDTTANSASQSGSEDSQSGSEDVRISITRHDIKRIK